MGSIGSNNNLQPITTFDSGEQINIIVESSIGDVTDRRILQEIAQLEKAILPEPISDKSTKLFSLSTIIQSVNTSSSMLYDRLCELDVSLVNEQGGEGSICQGDNPYTGTYNIPSQSTIHLIINKMYDDDGSPGSLLDIMAKDSNSDSILDLFRIVIVTQKADEIREDILEFIEEHSAKEKPCDYDHDDTDNQCTWNDMGLKMEIVNKDQLDNKFGFNEQGFVIMNENLYCLPDDCPNGGWRDSTPFRIRYASVIDYTTLMRIFPSQSSDNISSNFENSEVKSLAEAILDCPYEETLFYCISSPNHYSLSDYSQTIIIDAFADWQNGPFSLLVNESGDFNIIWIHSKDMNIQEYIPTSLSYKTIQYGKDDSIKSNNNLIFISAITLLSFIAIFMMIYRFRKVKHTRGPPPIIPLEYMSK